MLASKNIDFDIKKMFLSRENINSIVSMQYKEYTKYVDNITLTYQNFESSVPNMMNKWLTKFNIDEVEYLDKNNWHQLLISINGRFVKEHLEYFRKIGKGVVKKEYKPEDTNVFRKKEYIYDAEGKSVFKNPIEMTAEDYKNIDAWSSTNVNMWNDKQRYNNKIPFWRAAMHKRNYDRDNATTGFRSRNPLNSSKMTPLRGYDMSEIIKSTGKYKDLSWTEF